METGNTSHAEKEPVVTSAMLLSAGLFLGQAQEAQVVVPVQYQQQASSPGLFGRWRANMQDRPVLSKIQDRFGSMFGRNQKQEMKAQGGTIATSDNPGTPSHEA